MTRGKYALFRAVFGTYLFVHFAQLVPYAAEVFSSGGVLPRGDLSPLLFLPNVLSFWDSPEFVVWLVSIGAGLGLFFAIGFHDRWAAFGLWYLWACLLGRNPLIMNPGIPYVGWMLLAHAVASRDGTMPREILRVAWILLALGYSYSGFTKLMSPSWQDGTALALMISNPLGRGGAVHDMLVALPPLTLKLAAWGALSAELFFAPLALSKRLRPWLWSMMLAMHATLIVFVDFADLSLGMVMIHLLTWPSSSASPDSGISRASSSSPA